MITQMQKKLDRFTPLNSVLDYKIHRLFLHYPYKLFYYYLYKKLVYQRTKKGKIKKVNTFFGNRMHIMLPASLDIFFFGLKSHPSEISLAKYLLHTLKEGDTMVDIGAHFGYYTMLASKIVGKDGKVVAIEASPETFKILQLNTENAENIEAKNVAMSDVDDTTIQFCVFPVFRSELNTLNPDQYKNSAWYEKEKGKMVEVPASTLTSLLERNQLHPKIIKIDVEGAEGMVMRGAVNKLEAEENISVIIEYVNDSKDAAPYMEAESLLKSISYQPCFILPSGHLQKIDGSVLSFMKEEHLVSENIVFIKN